MVPPPLRALPLPRRLRPAAFALLLAAAPLPAQPPSAPGPGAPAAPAAVASALEARLPGLTGVERGRALAQLVDAYKLDQPALALERGQEALRVLAEHPDSAAQVTAMTEMGWALMMLGRYDEAVSQLQTARTLAERVGHRVGVARALSNLGSLAQRRGDPESAVAHFVEALAIQRDIGDQRQIANSLNNLGFVHSTDLADYDGSLAYHLEALRIRERLGHKQDLALSLNNVGIVYTRLRQYDRALDYLLQALALRQELGIRTRIASTHSNLGDAYLERADAARDDLARALLHHQAALAIRESLRDRSAIAVARRSVAAVYLAMGRTELARRHVLEALRIGDEAGDHGVSVQNLLVLAAVERAAGRPAVAEGTARRALARAQANGLRELERRSWEELANAQEAGGRTVEALRSHRRFKAVSDSIYDHESARRIAALERHRAAEQREHAADRRRSAAQLDALEESRRSSQRTMLASVLVVLLGAVGYVLHRRRTDRMRLAEELSVTDALTGARNRRYVQQTIGVDVAASLRRHRDAAARGRLAEDADLLFLLLDIDHFKQINDVHGHAAGDRVLVELAGALHAVCRESDVVVRWGGEEFLVVSRFTDRAQAGLLAERMRQVVAAHATRLAGGHTLHVTCSLGWSVFPLAPDDPDAAGWEAVVALADHALYTAKRQGRNAWVGYAGGHLPRGCDPPHAAPRDVEAWVAEGRLMREASGDARADAPVSVAV